MGVLEGARNTIKREEPMTQHKTEKWLAFEHLAVDQTDVLYRYGLSLTRNASDADDLVQETFLKAYRFWHRFEPGTNVRAWLFRILKNAFINIYRKKLTMPEMQQYQDEIGLSSSQHAVHRPSMLQAMMTDDVFGDEVSDAISSLAEKFRTVVILCDIEGLTYREIASFVDCPVGTVRSRIHRGRKLLQAHLYEYAKDLRYRVPERTYERGMAVNMDV
jgi:RNA polymerase sigma-70 factor (ECF subfamily)